MFTYLEVEAIVQSVLNGYMDQTCRDVAEKVVLGGSDYEIRILAGRPKGAAEMAIAITSELKKREEAQDD